MAAAGEPALSGDPVRELMAAHQELCERACHPLEIAAALEEAGIGAATAGRYRHGDVFSLAEEMFARVPRKPGGGPAPSDDPGLEPDAAAGRRVGLGRTLGLLGALCLPLTTPGRAGVALVLAAGAATAAARGSARWVRHVGQVQLRSAATIAEFRARMRPVLPVALGLHLAALALLSFGALAVLTALAPRAGPGGGLLHGALQQAGPAQWSAQVALGLLVASAEVLRRCGHGRAAPVGLLAADALAAGALLLRAGGLLPGWTAAPGATALFAAGAVALVLLPYAWAVLGRPGSYR